MQTRSASKDSAQISFRATNEPRSRLVDFIYSERVRDSRASGNPSQVERFVRGWRGGTASHTVVAGSSGPVAGGTRRSGTHIAKVRPVAKLNYVQNRFDVAAALISEHNARNKLLGS